jgi:hypothetical protein
MKHLDPPVWINPFDIICNLYGTRFVENNGWKEVLSNSGKRRLRNPGYP